MPTPLPIDDALPDVLAALRAHGAVVLVAPPGAGKTTRVPPALLDAGLAGDGRVLLLQPRRVAARSCAARIADERQVRLGGEVGYRIRFEDRTGPDTRLEVLTEGLLTRRLQADPFLEGVGCVVLDEFHERSLHADLALAFLREIRADVRDDLAVVVMSATLDPGPVAEFLGCPVVHSEGRTFPVQVSYDPRPDDRHPADRCALAVRQVLRQTDAGHVLAFLPGVGEIERAREHLSDLSVPVLPLHGSLPSGAQDLALAASAQRKVVLATNIAETSVTLPGVRAVVDSGLARVPRYDAAIGLTRLELGPVGLASADQRAGRAGRTGPGVCRRLWTESRHRRLPAAEQPEIQRVDLARTVLEVRAWGADPFAFHWFQAPDPATLERADAVLRRLGAVDDAGLTALGRTLLRLPVPPRLGRVVVAAHEAGHLSAGAAAAAIAEERDLFTRPPDFAGDSDLGLRLAALARPGGFPVHRGRLRRVKQARDQLVAVARRALGRPLVDDPADDATLTQLLLTGFPDRVALRRRAGEDRFKLAGGAGARLDRRSVVKDARLVLAVGLEGARRGERAEHMIRVACALAVDDLPTTTGVETRFDSKREGVVQVRATRFGELVLAEHPVGRAADPAAVEAALAEAAAAAPARAFDPDRDTAEWLARLRWLAAQRPELALPTFPELGQAGPVTDLVRAVCSGCRKFDDTRRVALLPLVKAFAGHAVQQTMDAQAPARLRLPDGTHKRLSYAPGEPPVLAARIQQMFGLTETPRIAGGKVPVVLHLLAPNQRPAQITQDLASFWANGYPEVRKDLRGRYPKHSWPEDPLTATPERRPRRKR